MHQVSLFHTTMNISSCNDSNFCDVRENLKDSADSFLGTNMVSETNVDSNKVQNENTEIESGIDEITMV